MKKKLEEYSELNFTEFNEEVNEKELSLIEEIDRIVAKTKEKSQKIAECTAETDKIVQEIDLNVNNVAESGRRFPLSSFKDLNELLNQIEELLKSFSANSETQEKLDSTEIMQHFCFRFNKIKQVLALLSDLRANEALLDLSLEREKYFESLLKTRFEEEEEVESGAENNIKLRIQAKITSELLKDRKQVDHLLGRVYKSAFLANNKKDLEFIFRTDKLKVNL